MTVGIIYIHGIHVRKPGYSTRIHQRVLDYLERRKNPEGFRPCVDVSFREVYWADIFEPLSDKLRKGMHPAGLTWPLFRNEALMIIAQTLGYEDDRGIGAHERIQDRIQAKLRELQFEAGADSPVIFVAHSLGSIIASDFIWDHQHYKRGFPRLRGLVTMGSPLAMWGMRWEDFGEPITMQSQGRPWINLVADSDVIGWPLRNLNDRYAQEVTEDVVLPVTWNWKTWSPTSHVSYWTSSTVARTIGDMAVSVWEKK